MNLTRVSKFLSLVLRHKPEVAHITLDENGWVDVDQLIAGAKRAGTHLDRRLIEEVIATNDKKRFVLSEDGMRIRANQGHSIKVNLDLKPKKSPEKLYHGTATRFIGSIQREGLVKGKRHHVHLSPDAATARNVGQRHGKPAILTIDAGEMHRKGYEFYLSENGVWLTDHVPVRFIDFVELR